MQVPLLDLKAQYAGIRTEIEKALLKVVESQHFILGPEVDTLERSLREYIGCKHAIGVSSGTDALLAALMAINLRPGDEVILPTYSFFATAGVVSRLNGTPVLVDIDPVTYNLDPKLIAERITSKTRAIIPVHLFGQSADMDPILEIGKKHGITIIEDAAQAIGVQYRDGRKLGTLGQIGCFSFFPSKNLGCFGDGGLVVTNDDELGERLKILRVHGSRPKYYHKTIGGNFRIDAIQAAVLNVKLPHLEEWSAARRRNADLYSRLFKEANLAKPGLVELPQAVYRESGVRNYHIYNQYVIQVDDRNGLQKHLADNGIGSEVYYPVPFHRQECFASLQYRDEQFPVSNRAAARSLAVPVYPELSTEQIAYVVEKVKAYLVR